MTEIFQFLHTLLILVFINCR